MPLQPVLALELCSCLDIVQHAAAQDYEARAGDASQPKAAGISYVMYPILAAANKHTHTDTHTDTYRHTHTDTHAHIHHTYTHEHAHTLKLFPAILQLLHRRIPML